MSEDEQQMDDVHDSFNPFDLENGAAEKLDPPAGFDGPVKSRRITDPLCLIILIATWGVATWIGVWSIQNGDLNAIVNPVDYRGRICGVDKDSNGQVLPTFWHPVDALSNGICVNECPSQSNLEPSSFDDLICKENDDILAIEGCLSSGIVSNDPSVLVTCGGCMYKIGSVSKGDYCSPISINPIISKINIAAETNSLDSSEFRNFEYGSFMKILMKDLYTAFPVISGMGFGGAVFLGLVFLILFRFSICIAPVIWISAGSMPFIFGGAGTLLFFLSSDYDLDQSGLHSNLKVLVVKILAYSAWAMSLIVLFSIVLLKRRIRQAISISKAASVAIKDIVFIFAIAFAQVLAFALSIGVLAFWMLMLASSRKSTEETSTLFGNELTYISQSHPALSIYM